jgi:hypothetical protein
MDAHEVQAQMTQGGMLDGLLRQRGAIESWGREHDQIRAREQQVLGVHRLHARRDVAQTHAFENAARQGFGATDPTARTEYHGAAPQCHDALESLHALPQSDEHCLARLLAPESGSDHPYVPRDIVCFRYIGNLHDSEAQSLHELHCLARCGGSSQYEIGVQR